MQLTPKQQAFIEAYCNIQSPTCSNATKSYIAAGYKNGAGVMQAACRLLSCAKIKQAIEQYQAQSKAKNEVKAEYIREQWLKLLSDCQDPESGKYIDRTTAQAVLRTMAQSLAMLTDKVQTEAIDTPILTDGEQAAIAEAAKVYKLKLSKGA